MNSKAIESLPWATLDDLLDAKEDVATYGRCWAEIVNIDGDVRLRRIAQRPTPRVYAPERMEAEA